MRYTGNTAVKNRNSTKRSARGRQFLSRGRKQALSCRRAAGEGESSIPSRDRKQVLSCRKAAGEGAGSIPSRGRKQALPCRQAGEGAGDILSRSRKQALSCRGQQVNYSGYRMMRDRNEDVMMNKYGGYVEKRLEYLEKVIKEKERCFRKSPEGSLRISRSRNRVQYYHVTEKGNSKGKYLKEKEQKLIKALAQKKYDEKILKCAIMEKNLLLRMQTIYTNNCIEDVYELLPESRRGLVTPIIMTDEQFVNNWESQPFNTNRFDEGAPVFLSEKNEKMRSKSEVILANKFLSLGIPYKYECPIICDDGSVFYPDFTGLNVRKRKVIYTEHFGKIDDDRYYEKNMRKLRIYASQGIFPGDQLCMTWETESHPLDIKYAESLLRHYYL